jgi:hypothetical protein
MCIVHTYLPSYPHSLTRPTLLLIRPSAALFSLGRPCSARATPCSTQPSSHNNIPRHRHTTMPLPIIHINGFPGTGKLTIARALVALINQSFQEGSERKQCCQQDRIDANGTTVITPPTASPSTPAEAEASASQNLYDAKFIHNHLLIDLAGACIPRTSSAYQPLRRAI